MRMESWQSPLGMRRKASWGSSSTLKTENGPTEASKEDVSHLRKVKGPSQGVIPNTWA